MSDDSFWEKPQGAAIFKHAVLKAYAPTFASKTGSRWGNGHVAIVDGYAGPGAYEDGSPGSPEQILDVATSVTAKRVVHPYFVEERKAHFDKLVALVEGSAAKGLATPLYGRCTDHLPRILTETQDMPLFVFIDPYGLGIPFDQLVSDVLGRKTANGAPVEVLVNFVRAAAYRTGGKVDIQSSSPTQLAAGAGSVARMNEAMGGDWWHPLYEEHVTKGGDGVRFAVEVRREYSNRVITAAGSKWGCYTAEVRDTPNGAVIYDLLLFTGHPQGAWFFNDAVSLARGVFREDYEGKQASFQLAFDEETFWQAAIEKNLTALAEEGKPVKVLYRMNDVYGSTLGEARGKHVKDAAKALAKRGAIACDTKKEPHQLVVAPAGTPL